MTAEAAEPFTPAELRADRLDELEGIWSAMHEDHPWEEKAADIRRQVAQYGAESARVDRILDWPQNEPERWS